MRSAGDVPSDSSVTVCGLGVWFGSYKRQERGQSVIREPYLTVFDVIVEVFDAASTVLWALLKSFG